ncbi:hypothetical protein RsTz2092_00370 [Deferribacterales bacterium RsTz2092]|nr:hypothetical protein AGMMS49941_01330 [Deferribacterales bacterium]
MKKLRAFIILILFTAVFCQYVNAEDATYVIYKDLFWKDKSRIDLIDKDGNLFTGNGKLVRYTDNDTSKPLQWEVPLVKGKRNGTEYGTGYGYLSDGEKDKEEFVNGIKKGYNIYDANDRLVFKHSNYSVSVEGYLAAIEYQYHDSGKLSWTIPHILDNTTETYIRSGLAKSYDEDGKLDGELTYINGKREGLYKLYYPNGQTKFKFTYKNDEAIKGVCVKPNKTEIPLTEAEIMNWNNGGEIDNCITALEELQLK